MESKQKRTRVVASVLALAGLAVFSLFAVGGSLEPSAPPGPTMKTLDEVEPRIPIHASDLPLTITEPNSYYLVEDVDFEPNDVNAITIECNDVTIDLMGYTLKGPDSGDKSGIYINGRTNVEIRNGTVRDFGYCGIREGISGRGHRVIGVRVLSNGYEGILLMGRCHLVKDCSAVENGRIGIDVANGTVTGNTAHNNSGRGISVGSGSTVTGNTARDNGSYGIHTGSGSTVTSNTAYNNSNDGIHVYSGCTVTGNTARDNGGDGIHADEGSTITGNTAYRNAHEGIYTGTASTVTGNTVYSNNLSDTANRGGIYVTGNCLVKGNTLNDNLQNNIYVFNSENAIEENLVTGSTGNGIYFNSTGNFYANNRASGNGTDYGGTLPSGGGDGGGNASF